jgi:FixJ family two-component response regulator
MASRPLVSVVDDDESVRESLPDLLRELGFEVEAFASAEDFLASDAIEETRCLVLDITMPEMSGPELQEELARQRRSIPIVFITANAEHARCPPLRPAGVVECLYKPFTESALLAAVTRCMA